MVHKKCLVHGSKLLTHCQSNGLGRHSRFLLGIEESLLHGCGIIQIFRISFDRDIISTKKPRKRATLLEGSVQALLISLVLDSLITFEVRTNLKHEYVGL